MPYQHSKVIVINTTAPPSWLRETALTSLLPSILTKRRSTLSQLPRLLPPVLVTSHDAKERRNVPSAKSGSILKQSSGLENPETSPRSATNSPGNRTGTLSASVFPSGKWGGVNEVSPERPARVSLEPVFFLLTVVA